MYCCIQRLIGCCCIHLHLATGGFLLFLALLLFSVPLCMTSPVSPKSASVNRLLSMAQAVAGYASATVNKRVGAAQAVVGYAA
jgi:hypothetical protein